MIIRPSTRFVDLRRHHSAPGIRFVVGLALAALLLASFAVHRLAGLAVSAAIFAVGGLALRLTLENRSLRKQMQAVELLGRSVAAGQREEMPLNRFLALARELLVFDYAVLWMADEGTAAMEPRAAYPESLPLPHLAGAALESYLGRIGQRPEPMVIERVPQDPGDPNATAPESWLLYPIVLHGRCVGAAQLVRTTAAPFGRKDVDRLSSLVPQAAVAFESVRLRRLMNRYQELMRRYHDLAQTDGLTGLYNHRRSQEILRHELARAVRYSRPLAVLMIDVDFFKQFNDTYGHPQGDALLKRLAEILKGCVRSTDHVGRYGGEEFIVILTETPGENAYALAERIRTSVEAESFIAGEDRRVRKTVSIGVSSYPEDATDPSDLLQLADAALFRAKRTGKNRVLTA